jgi:hypothetical protein
MWRLPLMWTRLAVAPLAAAIAVACVAPKSALGYDQRIAVLIGIGNYERGGNKAIFRNLDIVANDLDAVGKVLQKLGFDEIQIYSDQKEPRDSHFEYQRLVPFDQASRFVAMTDIGDVINPLLKKLHIEGKGTLLLIYFSGHGGVLGETERVLAMPESVKTNPDSYYRLRNLLHAMADLAPNTSKMLIVDACADKLGINSPAVITRQEDDLPTFLFASRVGEASYYDKGLGLSVFTYHLIEALSQAEALHLGEVEGQIDSGAILGYVQDHVPKHQTLTVDPKKLQSDKSQRYIQHPTGSNGRPLVLAEYQVKRRPSTPGPGATDAEKANYLRLLREASYGSAR